MNLYRGSSNDKDTLNRGHSLMRTLSAVPSVSERFHCILRGPYKQTAVNVDTVCYVCTVLYVLIIVDTVFAVLQQLQVSWNRWSVSDCH